MPITVPGPLLLVLNHFFLTYEHQPMLPIDVELCVMTPDLTATITHKYVQQLKNHLEWAFQRAKEVNGKEIRWHKKNYDHKIWCTQLEVGDLVLVHQ